MSGGDWTLEACDTVRFARSAIFDGVTGLCHAFSVRRDVTGNPFDLGRAVDDEPEASERCRRLLAAVGLGGQRAALVHQVHGSICVGSDGWAKDGGPPRADAVLSNAGCGAVPAVRTADCLPVLLVDRQRAWAAAAHAGWRGLAAGVLRTTVAELRLRGVDVRNLLAAIGPSIGPCCYRVGPEVLEAVARACGAPVDALASDGNRLDLRLAAAMQLAGLGIESAAISIAPWCTACRPELFYSYRRDGPGTGSQLSCIGWADRAPVA